MEKIAGCMAKLRETPPDSFATVPVEAYEDYRSGTHIRRGGGKSALTLPKNDTLRWLLANESWIVVRPSGTEPKLKLYIGARANSKAELDATLSKLMQDVDARLKGYLA